MAGASIIYPITESQTDPNVSTDLLGQPFQNEVQAGSRQEPADRADQGHLGADEAGYYTKDPTRSAPTSDDFARNTSTNRMVLAQDSSGYSEHQPATRRRSSIDGQLSHRAEPRIRSAQSMSRSSHSPRFSTFDLSSMRHHIGGSTYQPVGPEDLKKVHVSGTSFHTAASTRSSAASFYSARASTTEAYPSRYYMRDTTFLQAVDTESDARSAQPLVPVAETLRITPWQQYLESRKLVPDFDVEMNWSGQGQHTEYTRAEASEIPLVFERLVGESATARVDSVRCRRIRLARKTVQCNRSMTRKDVLMEVEHLQQLRNPHIVRLIGTYTTGLRNLSVLLYPLAEYNLEQFLATIDDPYDDYIIPGTHTHVDVAGRACKRIALHDFFGCLASAVEYIHRRAIKHMDIKPKNILVRAAGYYWSPSMPLYTMLLADFGIARSYASVAHADTDGPTSFTRKYAAPEVIAQAQRGMSADIFSLACVYVEIRLALSSATTRDALDDALDSNEEGDGSYSANIPAIILLLNRMSFTSSADAPLRSLTDPYGSKDMISRMLSISPPDRPTIHSVTLQTGPCRCGDRPGRPELEVAHDLDVSKVKARHTDFLIVNRRASAAASQAK